MNEQDKILPWLKWFTKDVKNYREVFNNEQMGELFFAVMKTVESNERVEVSNEIKFAYLQLCTAVDEAKAAYFKKCETNAMNGAKGGKAKAASTKLEAKENGFKPPSKTEFRNMAKHICKKYDFSCCDAYEIDTAFDFYATNNWAVDGIPIRNKKQLECAAYAQLCDCLEARKLFKVLLSSDKDDSWGLTDFDYMMEYYNPIKNCYCESDELFSKNFLNASEFVEWWFADDGE